MRGNSNTIIPLSFLSYIMESVNEIYNSVFRNVIDIYNIFIDYYGEDFVDLQELPQPSVIEGMTEEVVRNLYASKKFIILVWFPEITITNEFDKSHIIKDLYVKVELTLEGTMVSRFTLNRATYKLNEIRGGYMHSHIDGINFTNAENFLLPCVGTGPIKRTVQSLVTENDLSLWQLFCLELDRYVITESLAGTPWRRLENIPSSGTLSRESFQYRIYLNKPSSFIVCNYALPIIQDFILYCVSNNVLNYTFDGYIKPAYNENDLVILLSSTFIKWYNKRGNPYKKLYSFDRVQRTLLVPFELDKGTLFRITNANYSGSTLGPSASEDLLRNRFINRKVCTFKNHTIYRRIEDLDAHSVNTENNTVLLLAEDKISYIVNIIHYILNYGFTNNLTSSRTTSGSKTICL